MKTKKIAILADNSLGINSSSSNNDEGIAEILLQRAVYRLNRLISPDLILILGDILKDFDASKTEKRFKLIEKLDSSYMIVSKDQCSKEEIIQTIFEESELFEKGKNILLNSPSLFESPYPVNVLTVQNGKIEQERHNLKMDEKLGLVDRHVHTNLAYCSENMSLPVAIELASTFGLKGICFNEHSGQLYFERKRYWNKTCMREGIDGAVDDENRMKDYIKLKNEYQNENVTFGLELDIDFQGNLIVADKDIKKFNYLSGAIHALPNLSKENPLQKADIEDFLTFNERLLSQNIDVLVHPFRVFRRAGFETPDELFITIAELLLKYDVAAEINFHTNEPPVEFIRICLEKGVKFSFGSDSHNLAEIGDFAYHLALLEKAGFNGDLKDIMI